MSDHNVSSNEVMARELTATAERLRVLAEKASPPHAGGTKAQVEVRLMLGTAAMHVGAAAQTLRLIEAEAS